MILSSNFHRANNEKILSNNFIKFFKIKFSSNMNLDKI